MTVFASVWKSLREFTWKTLRNKQWKQREAELRMQIVAFQAESRICRDELHDRKY